MATQLIQSEAQILVDDILDGKVHPYGANGYYGPADWAMEAEYARDTGDFEPIDNMIAREDAYLRFRDWQAGARSEAETERREFFDFTAWLGGSR
jgi:hypothetical protein